MGPSASRRHTNGSKPSQTFTQDHLQLGSTLSLSPQITLITWDPAGAKAAPYYAVCI